MRVLVYDNTNITFKTQQSVRQNKKMSDDNAAYQEVIL